MPLPGKTRVLFRIFGIPIKVHLTWFLLLALIIYSLGGPDGLFRRVIRGPSVSESTFWVLAVLGALGLFASLIVHEMCHSIVARHTGTPVLGITLFIFGGVSELGDEPPTAESEFLMAVVGPLSSLLIGGVFLALWAAGAFAFNWPIALRALLGYLGGVNIALAVFNSVPAFPLDGGRVVRSILWGVTGNLRTATTIAAGIGSGFGLVMIVGGVLSLLMGTVIGGIWFIFIGFFLRQAAQGSLQHTIMRQDLAGERVGRFMTPNPVAVGPHLELRRFVDGFVLPYHFAVFPVVDEEGRWIGVVHARDPARVDQAQWETVTVGDIMRQPTPDMAVGPDADAVDALALLAGGAGRRLIVVDHGRPIGILSLRDLMDFLALKVDLRPRR